MGTKLNPGNFDCYHNALPDEPMFILLGRDPSAPRLVAQWADIRADDIYAHRRPKADEPVVTEAYDCAAAMIRWRKENDGRWRIETSPRTPSDQINTDLLAALRIARDHVQVALEAAIEEMDEGGHPAEWRAEAEATAKTLQDHVHQIDAAIAKAEGA